VAVERVLAQTAKVAVCVTRLAAYPTGFEFDVVTMAADEYEDLDPMMFHHPRLRHGAAEDIPPEMLRFGVQFSDGSKATNTGVRRDRGKRPAGPILQGGGGGGGGGSWNQTQWVWPLPPPGPLALVCEWPATGIPLTRCELDAQTILDASTRAQVIFSDAHLPEPPDESDGPAPVAHAG
jgi:hypothetical protein